MTSVAAQVGAARPGASGGVLVTGGSGFLGRALTAVVPGVRALSSSELDLTDGRAVAEAIGEWKPEVVVHLAARVGGIAANIAQQADFLVDNLRIDANLLAALRVHRPRHLIAMLSTCMYPDELPASDYPMTEDLIESGPPPPTNAAYASAKRALWHGVRALHGQYDVPYTALVPSNLYGPGDHFGDRYSHFLAAAISKVEASRQADAPVVEFFGTGVALRQYVYVDDVARLVSHLVEGEPANDTLNIAPEGHQTIAQLAQAVADAAGYRGEVRFTGEGPDGQFRKDVTAARLAQAVPAWAQIETDLDSGLRRTIAWYRESRPPA